MDRLHTDRAYEAELAQLRERLLLMGARVEELVEGAVRALAARDSELARRFIELDHTVNRLEVEIDEQCMRILARRQPVASDLRFLTLALKIVTDLERMGDLGVNICERVIELNQDPPLGPYPDLTRMAQEVRGMLRQALNAFVAHDADAAREVIERDRLVDALHAQLFRELLTRMMDDTRNIYRASRVQLVGKYLERLGDHVTNVAEMVIFMVKGKDIRHTGGLDEPPRRVPHGILFLCVQNSARSQMAEAWARKLLPASIRVWSAGSQPAAQVNPLAVQVMQEVGIDASAQRPKRISDVPLGDVDTVVTLCGDELCVVLPGAGEQQRWGLPDPAAVGGDEEERRAAFRATRDEIRRRLEALVASWEAAAGGS